MNEKAAQPELGTFEHPRIIDESRPEPLFQVDILYSSRDSAGFMASGVDLRDGCFLIAKPRLVTRMIQGEWLRFWSNEVFKFVNIVEVLDVTITRDED